ncbi:MAG: outer membrane beta-barrel protein [Bacteroidota bacterium]
MKIQSYFIAAGLFFLIFSTAYSINTDDTADSLKKHSPGLLFGNIYTGFYYGINENMIPKSAFDFTTGILGYCRSISDNVKGTIIYDVTRTTNFNYADTSGISNYFEGSKYTAYLKMAQIDWRINKRIEFNVGQLLNEQYLTVQDKFWGYRYIAFTQQEINRMGMPADFGVRVKAYFLKEKLQFSLTACNGEGPFRYQDSKSKFLVSGNLEYRPNDKWILKVYGDFQKPQDHTLIERFVFSGFLGYKVDKLKIGAEFNEVINEKYIEYSHDIGISFYAAYSLSEKIDVLGRYDYIDKESELPIGYYGQFIVGGIQYQPVKNFVTSLNIKHNEFYNYYLICANFGIKF